MIGQVAVVIPARDESELIGRCLDSVLVAARALEEAHPRVVVTVIVVADRCTDDTADVARGFAGVTVLEIGAGNVGVARATGVERALASLGRNLGRIWIANTDADSAVPRGWLLEHLRLAAGGADVVLGTVRPDDLVADRESAWDELHADQAARMEVHGANLGVRADFYRSAQGFPALAEHEDVAFVTDCGELGAMVVSTDGCEVATSGRQTGRTPGGFARYLRDDLIPDPAR